MMALVPSRPTDLFAFWETPDCSPHREDFCGAWGSPLGSAGRELPGVFARAPPAPRLCPCLFSLLDAAFQYVAINFSEMIEVR